MGDDILKAELAFYPKEFPELPTVFKRLSQVAMEHEYQRFQFDLQSTYRHGLYGIDINYRLPDNDADRDGFFRCALMIFFERVVGILEPMFGVEGREWDLSCEMRLP